AASRACRRSRATTRSRTHRARFSGHGESRRSLRLPVVFVVADAAAVAIRLAAAPRVALLLVVSPALRAGRRIDLRRRRGRCVEVRADAAQFLGDLYEHADGEIPAVRFVCVRLDDVLRLRLGHASNTLTLN